MRERSRRRKKNDQKTPRIIIKLASYLFVMENNVSFLLCHRIAFGRNERTPFASYWESVGEAPVCLAGLLAGMLCVWRWQPSLSEWSYLNCVVTPFHFSLDAFSLGKIHPREEKVPLLWETKCLLRFLICSRVGSDGKLLRT